MKCIELLAPISVLLVAAQGDDEWQLKLVQILIRNGISYPQSLYADSSNPPDVSKEELGQLTLSGQKQLYAIGKVLKEQYKDFLSSNPHELIVQSTYLEKCMSSALCLFASLYEPDENWEFIPGLRWQPIPVHYEPPHRDKILFPILDAGNKRKEYVYNSTLKQMKTLKDIGGPLLVQITQNFIAGSQDLLNDTKIFIFSGQSFHLSGVLGALEYFPNEDPPFAASLVMELLEREQGNNDIYNDYGVRIKYYNNIDDEYNVGKPETLYLPGCTEICPLQVLENQAKPFEIEPRFRLF